MKELNFVCVECGEEVTIYGNPFSSEEIMIEDHICEDCFYEAYDECIECGEWHKMSDMSVVHDNNDNETYYICNYDKKYSRKVRYCDYHNRWEYDNVCDFIPVENYGIICQDAYEWGNFFTCDYCGVVYHDEDGHWIEYEEEMYCNDCYEEYMENHIIKNYHHHEDDYMDCKLRFGTDDESKYYGLEIETETYGIYDADEVAKKISDSTNDFVFEYDGSLDNGFEIISYPFTKNYMIESLKYDIRHMCEILKNNGCKVYDSCGIHVHISREGREHTNNLICLVEYFKEELTKFSRRELNKLNRWSQFHTDGYSKTDLDKDLIMKCVDNYTRYRAINVTNDDTLEIRIFASSTKYEEIMAIWQLVANMNEYARENKIDEDLSNLSSFYEIATYDKANSKYVAEYLKTIGLAEADGELAY